jgi:hypothetical protein
MTDENFDYLWQRRYDVKVCALMNRIYYQERQRIFEWCAAFITASSTASLVFGYGNKARDSVKRSAEWAKLERDIEREDDE